MSQTIIHRAASLFFAAFMTFGMLAAVNGLATSDAPQALWARVQVANPA